MPDPTTELIENLQWVIGATLGVLCSISLTLWVISFRYDRPRTTN